MIFDPSSIQEIDINWAAGDIYIMAVTTDEITVSESDVHDEKYAMVYRVDEGNLEMDFCEGSFSSGFGINTGTDISKDLYIEVPKDWAGRGIELNIASANVELHNLTVREVDISGASGNCDFLKCNIQDLDISTASGNIYYEGTLNALEFDAASGKFTGKFSNTPSRIDMEGMSSSLDISLPEDSGCTVSMDGMSSRLTSDFENTGNQNGMQIYGNGECRINVSGMSCEVAIHKNAPLQGGSAAETTTP
jgi:hypothetical protein